MSVMFTEEVDRMRIDLNAAERSAQKAEYDKLQAEKRLRGEQDRAEVAEKRLSEFQIDLGSYRRRLTELQRENDRLSQLEGEVSELKATVVDLTERLVSLQDEHEATERDLADTRGELAEKTVQVSTLTAELTAVSVELDPTRKLLAAVFKLKRWERIQSEVWKELGA